MGDRYAALPPVDPNNAVIKEGPVPLQAQSLSAVTP